MNFSARTLAVVLLASSMLGGCFDSSEKHEWQVEPQGTQSQFPVPQKVQEKVEVENLRAEVQLNNGDWQPLIIDGATARGSLTGLEAGKYTISIRFVYVSGIYDELTLAQATKSVTIVAGTKTTLAVLETDYDLSLFDADRDGLSNADEISLGTNPFDASDPGNTRPASSSVSSLAIPSSAADGSSSDSLNTQSSSQSTEQSSSATTDSSSSDSNNNGIPTIVTANAGSNVTVDEGGLVTLQGSAELSNGSPTYLWEYIGSEPFNEPLTGANTATLSFTAGNYLEDVTFEFRLTVSVDQVSASDTVLVTVRADNDAPVVSFFPNQIDAAPNEPIDLVPSAEDPEGVELSFSWQQLAGDAVQVPLAVSSRSARLTTPQLQMPDQPITLTYELTVSDGVNTSVARVVVVVTDTNRPPIARITTLVDETLFAENTAVVLSAESSSDDYTPASRLSYQWALETTLPYALDVTDWQSRELRFTAPNLAVDQELRFSLIVTDDSSPKLSSTKTFRTITIDADNNPAVLTLGRSAGSAEPGEQGITLTATATDPDLDQAGLTYTFEWQNPAGFDVLNATSGEQVTFDAPKDLLEDTNLEFTVNATQVGAGALPIVSDSISVLIGGFAPPTAVAALANAMVTPSEAADFDLTAAGSLNGTNAITGYSWSTTCDGDFATEAAAQVVTFSPNNRAANDVCSFTVEVTDGTAEGTVSDTLDVTITATDEPPVLAPLATINAAAGQTVNLNASGASDPENTPLTFSWSTASGVALTNADTAIASFEAPDSDEPLTLTFTVTITDGNPENDLERTVTVEVAGNNTAPVAVITAQSDSVAENTPVTLSGETSNDTHTESAALEYQWEQLSPTVAEFDLGITDWQSSTLSFTSPDLAANQVVTFGLTVTDAQGLSSMQDTYGLTLEGENSAPAVTVTASQNSVGAGASVTLTAQATNLDRDQQAINYTYNWSAPAGFENVLAGLSAAELASSQITFTAPMETAQLVFRVTAIEDITDGLTSEAATTTINVTVDYVPPTADVTLVGGGSAITEGVAATFSAASSQLGTDGPVTYAWTSTCPGQFSATDTVEVGFTADNLTASVDCDVTVEIDDQSGNGAVPVQATLPVTVNAVNEIPVINFENTQLTVAPNAAVVLAPETVADPEGEPLNFMWEESLTNPVMVGLVVDGDSASFTAPTLPSADATLTLTFVFTAFDGETSAEQTITVTVQDNNDVPVARITTPGDVTTVAENSSLVLSGLTSTDKYTATENLAYQWALETDFAYDLGITDWSSPTLTVNAPNLAEDVVLRFSLVVTDDSTPALSSMNNAAVDITIDADNNPAVLTLGRSAGSAEPGEQGITLTATATDPDLDQAGLTYTFEWLNPAGFDVLNATTGEQVTFDAPDDLLEDTNLEFTVNATQVGTGALPIDSDTISVLIGGFAPPTAVAALTNAMVTPSEAADFDLTAVGSLNGTNAITGYSWSTTCDGDFASETTAQVVTFSPSNRAANDVCSFTVEVTDGTAEGTVSDTLNVTITATDEPPVLAPLATINAAAGQTVNLNASAASDPENTPLTFSWSTASGVALTNADTAIANFEAPDSDTPQTLTFTVTITDGNPENDLERTVTVEVAGNNTAPVAVITAQSDSVAENTPVTLSGETSNDTHTESAALEYQWEQLSPTVAEFDLGITDWQSSTLSFTSPDLAANQVVTFGLTVTDAQGLSSMQDTYGLTLEGENSAPAVTVTASQNAAGAGVEVTLTATAINPDVDQQSINYTYTWTAPAGFESLLAGLSDAVLASNQITFTTPSDLPAESTPLTFRVSATEDITDGLTSELAQTTVTVGQGYVPPVPAITLVGGGSTIAEGAAATFTAANTQIGTISPVTYEWSSTCPGQFDVTDAVEVNFTGDSKLLASVDCEVTVAVDDQSGNAAVEATLPVTLSAKNDAPVTTGPDAELNAIANMPIALAGFTVSDIDTDQAQLTYEWTANVAGAEAWLSDTTVLEPTLLAPPSPVNVAVVYTLRAIDGGEAERTAAENAVAAASVTVNIAHNNDKPRGMISLVMPDSVTEIGESMTVNLAAVPMAGETAFDNFTDVSELTFTWTPSAELQALGAMAASGRGVVNYSLSLPPLEQPLLDMNVALVIRDPNGGISNPIDFPFAIKAENFPPEVSVTVSPQTVSENQTVTFTATAEDPEKIRSLSYSWQQVDADGNPVTTDFEPQVSCATPATAECSFQAPFVQDDTSIYMAVTVSEEGAEPFLKQTTAIANATITSGYVAWVLELQASAAPREGEPLSISINALTEGTSQITNYDWTASNCLDVDFSTQVGANADTLNIALPSGQKLDYACDISLVVTDEANQTADAQLNLTVDASDDIPVAVIADRSLTISGSNPDDPSDESLDGSASFDDENDTLIYVWEQSPADSVQVNWLSRGEDNGVAFFSVPEQAEATLLNFTLTVCDAPNDPARCDATPETITLTVSPTNYPPVAQIEVSDAVFDPANGRYVAQETEHPSQREAGEGEVVVTLSGEGSSDPLPNNGTLNYAWTIALDDSEAPLDLQGAADLTEWAQTHLQIAPADWTSVSLQVTTPNLLTSRTFIFELTVSDGELASEPYRVSVYIEADNDEPQIIAIPQIASALTFGGQQALTVEAVDPEGGALTYSWGRDTNFADGLAYLSATNTANPEFNVPLKANNITYGYIVTVADETGKSVLTSTIAVPVAAGYVSPAIDVTQSDFEIAEKSSTGVIRVVARYSVNIFDQLTISTAAGIELTSCEPAEGLDGKVTLTARTPAIDDVNAQVTFESEVALEDLYQRHTCRFELTFEDGISPTPIVVGINDVVFAGINGEPSTPTIEGPTMATGNEPITLTVSGSTDPEGLAVTYSWQEIDAMGAPVKGGVACETTTPTTCSFTAPDEDRTLIMQVIASDGVKRSDSSLAIDIAKQAVWNIQLEVTSLPPEGVMGFDAVEEQAAVEVSAVVITRGASDITEYDWSASTCTLSFDAPQPVIADFTGTERSSALVFNPPKTAVESYTCDIQLTIVTGTGAEEVRTPIAPLTVSVQADNDLPSQPVIDTSVNANIFVDDTINLALVNPPLTDSEGEPVIYAWAQEDVNGALQAVCQIGTSCLLTFNSVGEYTVYAVATTNIGADFESNEVVKSEPFIINVSLATPNEPPTISTVYFGREQPFSDMTVFQVWAPIPYEITNTSGSGNVTVTSSNPAVAEVVQGQGGRGEILIKGIIDDAIITFTEEQGNGFEAISVSYTISVQENRHAILDEEGNELPELNFNLVRGGAGTQVISIPDTLDRAIGNSADPILGDHLSTKNLVPETGGAQWNISAGLPSNFEGSSGSDIHLFNYYTVNDDGQIIPEPYATLRVNVTEMDLADVVIPQPRVVPVVQTSYRVGDVVELELLDPPARDSGGRLLRYIWRLIDENGEIVIDPLPPFAGDPEFWTCSDGETSTETGMCAWIQPESAGSYRVAAVAYVLGSEDTAVISEVVELTFTEPAAPPTVLDVNGQSFTDMTVSQVAFPIPFDIAATFGSGEEVIVESDDETVATISRTGPTLGEIVIVGTGNTTIRFTEPAGNGFEAAVFEFNLTVAANTLTITNENGDVVDTLNFEVVSGGVKTQTIFIEELRSGGAVWFDDPEDVVGDGVSRKTSPNGVFEWQISTRGTFGSDIHQFKKIGPGGASTFDWDGEASIRVNVTEMDLADVVTPKPVIAGPQQTEYDLGDSVEFWLDNPPERDNGGRLIRRLWMLVGDTGELTIVPFDDLSFGCDFDGSVDGKLCTVFRPEQAGEYTVVALAASKLPIEEGDYVLSEPVTVTFNPPLSAEITSAPDEIFDASFAWPISANVQNAGSAVFEWQANHTAITFNNQGSLTNASMTIDASILEGIERGDEAGRNITLSLLADGQVVATHNMRIVLPFVTVWDTTIDNTDVIEIFASPDYAYNYMIDWGDGVYRPERHTDTQFNTYGVDANGQLGGEFTIKIIGEFPKFEAGNDAWNLVAIERWGDQQWQSFNSAFSGAENLRGINAPDSPDLSMVSDVSYMFAGMAFNQNAITANLSAWDVSVVEDFTAMFVFANFNGDVSGWKPTSARLMNAMFNESTFDGDISSWPIGTVQEMNVMFSGAALSRVNYDALLTSWSQQNVNANVTFNAGESQYTSAAADARQLLSDPNGANWKIFDGGLFAPVEISFAPSTVMLGEGPFVIEAEGGNEGLTFTNLTPSIADVNPETGEVTVKGSGRLEVEVQRQGVDDPEQKALVVVDVMPYEGEVNDPLRAELKAGSLIPPASMLSGASLGYRDPGEIAMKGDVAYVNNSVDSNRIGPNVIDYSIPESPVLRDNVPGLNGDLFVLGDILISTSTQGGADIPVGAFYVAIYDVSNPSTPIEIQRESMMGVNFDGSVRGDADAFVSASVAGISFFKRNASNTYDTSFFDVPANNIEFDGEYLISMPSRDSSIELRKLSDDLLLSAPLDTISGYEFLLARYQEYVIALRLLDDSNAAVLDIIRYSQEERFEVVSSIPVPDASGIGGAFHNAYIYGASLFFASGDALLEYDLSIPEKPFNRSKYRSVNSARIEGFAVGDRGALTKVLDIDDGSRSFDYIEFASVSIDVASSNVSADSSVVLDVSWSGKDYQFEGAQCLVTGGECKLFDVDYSARTAKVHWLTPPAGQHQLTVAIGSHVSQISGAQNFMVEGSGPSIGALSFEQSALQVSIREEGFVQFPEQIVSGGEVLVFTSSNPSVANVDRESGDVTVAGAGVAAIKAYLHDSEGELLAIGSYSVEVSTFSGELVKHAGSPFRGDSTAEYEASGTYNGTFGVGTPPFGVGASKDYAYYSRSHGFDAVSLANVANPVSFKDVDLPAPMIDGVVHGNKLYAVYGSAETVGSDTVKTTGISVWDITRPSVPVHLGDIAHRTGGNEVELIRALRVSDDYVAYIKDNPHSIYYINTGAERFEIRWQDVRRIHYPNPMDGTSDIAEYYVSPRSFMLDGDNLYVGAWGDFSLGAPSGYWRYDLSAPAGDKLLGQYIDNTSGWMTYIQYVSKGHLTAHTLLGTGGAYVIDFSTPTEPQVVASGNTLPKPRISNSAVDSQNPNVVYFSTTDEFGEGDTVKYDMSDPAAPVLLGKYFVASNKPLYAGDSMLFIGTNIYDTTAEVRIAAEDNNHAHNQTSRFFVAWDEPVAPEEDVVCRVTHGRCTVPEAEKDLEFNQATVEWTLPFEALGHPSKQYEMSVMVGGETYYISNSVRLDLSQ